MSSIPRYKLGFTIVELLIVIVVIGILAAITIVAYNGIQNRASDSAVQSDLANFSKKLQLHFAEKDVYPANNTELEALSVKPSQSNYATGGTSGNLTYCTVRSGANARYAVAARSKSGQLLTVSSTGPITYTGTYNGAHATVCPNLGIPTTETGYGWGQGYQAPSWIPPGWMTWAQ